MKRDWDLIRTILERLEALEDPDHGLYPEPSSGNPAEVVAYHFQLLIEAGLAHGKVLRPLGSSAACHLTRLTWEGHELLDQIRSDTIWSKVKETAKSKGLDLSVQLIGTLAKAAIQAMLGAQGSPHSLG